MTYVILIAIALLALYTARLQGKIRKQSECLGRRLTNVHRRISDETRELENHFHKDINILEDVITKKYLKAGQTNLKRSRDLRRVINELANLSGYEVVVEEREIIEKDEMLKLFKGTLPSFLSEILEKSPIPMPKITEQVLVIKKKVATKKVPVK